MNQLLIKLEVHGKPSSVNLVYEIGNDSLSQAWLQLLRKGLHKKQHFFCNGFGNLFVDRNVCIGQIKKISRHLKKLGLDYFNNKLAGEIFDTPLLLDLHEAKEFFYLFFENALTSDEYKIFQLLTMLNWEIHRLESLGNLASPTGRLVVSQTNAEIAELEQFNLSQFSLNVEFGNLYLDYFTNGRDVLDALLQGKQVTPTPQTTFSNYFWLSFESYYHEDKRPEIVQWLNENNNFGHRGIFPIGFHKLGKLQSNTSPEKLRNALKRWTGQIQIAYI